MAVVVARVAHLVWVHVALPVVVVVVIQVQVVAVLRHRQFLLHIPSLLPPMALSLLLCA